MWRCSKRTDGGEREREVAGGEEEIEEYCWRKMKAPVLSAENTDSLHFYTEHDFKQNSAPKHRLL